MMMVNFRTEMMPGRRLILLLVTLLLSSVKITAGQDPQVRSPAGTFRGKVLTAPSGARYESYRGIPYALPPTGERRFAVPEPYPVIQGVYDATEFGPICFQQLKGTLKGQEDCLFLNVFTPINVKETAADSCLKSVLVFIHPGGLFVDSSNVYLPGDLVTKADILVVAMNYRLSWLGFLYGNSDSLPGNQGYWDQVLALRWVKDNIRAFGGDPDDVTLSGESAGSFSTSVLSISPLGKDLFNKAILMSGTAFLFPSPDRRSNSLLEIISQQVGCSGNQVAGHEEEVVTCLKQQPAENFYFSFEFSILKEFTSSGNDILPRYISQLLDDPEYLSQVGFFDRYYFISITKDDGYLLADSIADVIDTSSFDSSVHNFSAMFEMPEDLVRILLTEYVKLYEGLEKAVISLITDVFFYQPSYKVLETYEKKPDQGKTTRNAYFMSFDHKPRYLPNNYMIHAFDLPYLFDTHPQQIAEMYYFFQVDQDFDVEDIQLKSDFIDLVSSFIKTGNPNYGLEKRNIVWPPFDTDKKSYLSFSLYPSVREDILANRRYIWDTLVPKWIQESQVQQEK